MSEELKNCPFCGVSMHIESTPHWLLLVGDHDEKCVFMGTRTTMIASASNDQHLTQVVSDWNTRATLSPAHIEDGEEVEVVGYANPADYGSYRFWVCAQQRASVTDPIMTVAQHKRIVSARASKAAACVENEREACERWIRQQIGMPARIPMDWDGPFNRYTWAAWSARAALSATPAAGVPDSAYARRIIEAGEKLYNELRQWLATESDPSSQAALQEWRKICAFTTPASEQQRVVGMPEGDEHEDHSASTAAIQFALELEDLEDIPAFLSMWNEGEFEAIRRAWPDCPDEVFIGADPLFKPAAPSQGESE